jgi:hypothetical protein
MTFPTRVRKAALGALTAGAALTALLAGAPAHAAALSPAATTTATHAATRAGAHAVIPMDAQKCNGNMCMYLSTPSSGTVYVSGWVANSGFTGYFELKGPGGLDTRSTPNQYFAVGYGIRWNNVSAVVGQYCVYAYSIYSGPQGQACANIE